MNYFTSAHPHVCGEHHYESAGKVAYFGSSPRVWGARVVMRLELSALRLIPTCVGSTALGLFPGVVGAAHPHVCGEHKILRRDAVNDAGSSPRVWGARCGHTVRREGARLIPTCVGSTRSDAPPKEQLSAHPHVCGEHDKADSISVGHLGSSPRVWGALWATRTNPSMLRLIPTCVGSTTRQTASA